ncbi:MAG: SDR family NAD(P)-dependent oxidoreductase [Candidatus Promineifilaceae bacterium]
MAIYSSKGPGKLADGARVALVTGATGAIGKAIARQLAANDPRSHVILVGRDEQKARAEVSDIRRSTGSENVWYEIANLARKEEIEALAARWPGRLDILINNAATSPKSRQETPEGIELQFATNVLGYFWMARAFEDILARSAPSRLINVASYWAGDLDLADLEFKKRRYNNNTAYRQSKQADRMLTAALAERLRPLGISVNACHPGDVNSRLSNDLGFGGHESPGAGARTPVWLATADIGQEATGKYFEHERETPCRFMADHRAVEALYAICLAY